MMDRYKEYLEENGIDSVQTIGEYGIEEKTLNIIFNNGERVQEKYNINENVDIIISNILNIRNRGKKLNKILGKWKIKKIT